MNAVPASVIVASAILHATNGRVNATVVFPHTNAGEIAVTASQTVPGDLAVLGHDELLAFHQSTVLMYLAVTPRQTIRLTDPPTFTFSLPKSSVMPAQYFLSYRGPSAPAWETPGEAARATADGTNAILSFKPAGLPVTLPAGETQNFVLYYPSEGAA